MFFYMFFFLVGEGGLHGMITPLDGSFSSQQPFDDHSTDPSPRPSRGEGTLARPPALRPKRTCGLCRSDSDVPLRSPGKHHPPLLLSLSLLAAASSQRRPLYKWEGRFVSRRRLQVRGGGGENACVLPDRRGGITCSTA